MPKWVQKLSQAKKLFTERVFLWYEYHTQIADGYGRKEKAFSIGEYKKKSKLATQRSPLVERPFQKLNKFRCTFYRRRLIFIHNTREESNASSVDSIIRPTKTFMHFWTDFLFWVSAPVDFYKYTREIPWSGNNFIVLILFLVKKPKKVFKLPIFMGNKKPFYSVHFYGVCNFNRHFCFDYSLLQCVPVNWLLIAQIYPNGLHTKRNFVHSVFLVYLWKLFFF